MHHADGGLLGQSSVLPGGIKGIMLPWTLVELDQSTPAAPKAKLTTILAVSEIPHPGTRD